VKENKDIKDTVKRLTEKIAIVKEQATQKGLAFNSLTPEQLEKKIYTNSFHFYN
jgi:hypothetical protein